jgi:hypothetical protein
MGGTLAYFYFRRAVDQVGEVYFSAVVQAIHGASLFKYDHTVKKPPQVIAQESLNDPVSENPFAPPLVDTLSITNGPIVVRVREPMPIEVRFATGLFVGFMAGITFLGSLLTGHLMPANVPVGVLILIGFFRGYSPARSAARGVAMIVGVLALLVLLGMFISGEFLEEPLSAVTTSGFVVVPLAIWVLLGRKRSARFFGLVCPTCDSQDCRPVNFMARLRRCRSCGTAWK